MPGYYLGQYWFRQLFSFNLPLLHSYIFTCFYSHFNFLTNPEHKKSIVFCNLFPKEVYLYGCMSINVGVGFTIPTRTGGNLRSQYVGYGVEGDLKRSHYIGCGKGGDLERSHYVVGKVGQRQFFISCYGREPHPFFVKRVCFYFFHSRHRGTTSTGERRGPFLGQCAYLVPGETTFSSPAGAQEVYLYGGEKLFCATGRGNFFCFFISWQGKGTTRGSTFYGGKEDAPLYLLSFPCRLFCQEKIFYTWATQGVFYLYGGTASTGEERGWLPLFARVTN